MAVQISKKRKVRAAARPAAVAGRLHIGGVAPEAAPGLAGAGGGEGMAADAGGWRRMGLGGSAGNMAAGGRGEGERGGPCEGPGLGGSSDSPHSSFVGFAQGPGLVCTGERGWSCAEGRGEVLGADELPCFFLFF